MHLICSSYVVYLTWIPTGYSWGVDHRHDQGERGYYSVGRHEFLAARILLKCLICCLASSTVQCWSLMNSHGDLNLGLQCTNNGVNVIVEWRNCKPGSGIHPWALALCWQTTDWKLWVEYLSGSWGCQAGKFTRSFVHQALTPAEEESEAKDWCLCWSGLDVLFVICINLGLICYVHFPLNMFPLWYTHPQCLWEGKHCLLRIPRQNI